MHAYPSRFYSRSWSVFFVTLCLLAVALLWQASSIYAMSAGTQVAQSAPQDDGDEVCSATDGDDDCDDGDNDNVCSASDGDDCDAGDDSVCSATEGDDECDDGEDDGDDICTTNDGDDDCDDNGSDNGDGDDICTAHRGDDDCDDDDHDGDDICTTSNGNDDCDDEDIRRYGYLVSRPDGKVGTWVIGSTSYTTTERSELETEHGALEVGVCTKVKSPLSNPTFAEEIESEGDYKCSGREDDDDDAEGKLYGLVEELPDGGREGIWIIGGMTFSATAQTEFDTDGGLFASGSLVKVKFYTTADETNVAREIELKYDYDDDVCTTSNGDDDDNDDDNDDDDDGDDDCDDGPRGSLGKVFALVEVRPLDTLTGTWKIGGVDYLADARTDFDHLGNSDDDFEVGDRVRVKYVVEENGTRRATDIDETPDTGGVDQSGYVKIVGFVEIKPQNFIGTWRIAGAEFEADLSTHFREDDGLFGVGAYVEVQYSIANDARNIHRIETNVPPGAGDDDTFGAIEAVGGQAMAANVDAVTAEGWTIGGQSYTVGAATDLDDNAGALVVGAAVMVNSYTTNNGQQVATQIRAVTLDEKVYLPLAQK